MMIFWIDIKGEEVEVAICHLKRNHAGGPDALSPEHLKYSGPIFRNWLCQIYNHICHLERIPQCFKHGIVIPAYKGKGRDPLLKKSYRGITLTSVLVTKYLNLSSWKELALFSRMLVYHKSVKLLTKREYHAKTRYLLVKRQMQSSSVRETMCTSVSMILPALLTQ